MFLRSFFYSNELNRWQSFSLYLCGKDRQDHRWNIGKKTSCYSFSYMWYEIDIDCCMPASLFWRNDEIFNMVNWKTDAQRIRQKQTWYINVDSSVWMYAKIWTAKYEYFQHLLFDKFSTHSGRVNKNRIGLIFSQLSLFKMFTIIFLIKLFQNPCNPQHWGVNYIK